MEENNLEQNIDPTSQIDQITKIPDPKPKPKVKNPKKIAAGKKLAQFNRLAKEKQKIVQENDEEPAENEESSFFPATSLTSIIALIGLGLTALDLFLRYKGQKNDNSRTVETDYNNDIDSEKEYYQNVEKMKEINSDSFGGME